MNLNDSLIKTAQRLQFLAVPPKTTLAVGLLVVLARAAFGQTAAISGVVRDQSGGAISGVEIAATQTATAQKRATLTDKNGNYVLSLLPIGDYQIVAAHPGFKTDVRTAQLRVGDRSSVDFDLALGDVAEKVLVSAEAPLVQAESSSTGAVVDNKRIAEIPLNGRQFQNLALMVPGTTDPAPGSSLGFRGGINVAGTRSEMTGFTLDGVDIVENLVKALSFKPSVDTIQEFRVDTSTYSAEYGRTAGGQVRATTKSGTNQLHGTLYEFVRNSAFDAKNFFDSPTAPIPGFRRNNFGGTAGGPIVKNRTFIFGAYEGLISRQAQTRTATVPTTAQLSGNFAGSKTIIDPFTGAAFPGNIIPSSQFSPVSTKIIEQYPVPNSPGSAVRNYVSSPTDVRNIHQFTSRVDHTFSSKNSIFGRYSFNDDFELDPFDVFSGITNLPSYGRDDYQRAQSALISDTHVFTPALIGQLSLGYNRFKQIRTNVSHENYPAIWGIQGTTTNLNEESGGVPAVILTGYDSLGKSNLPSDRVDTTYQAIGSLTYIRGSHTIKVGGDGNGYSTMRLNNGGGLGSYTFSGQYSGNAVADLLLGYRMPLSKESFEELMQVYWEGREHGNFESGIRMALQYILANPEFVFRFERTPAGVRPGEDYRVSDLELASRLSYFLWSSLPDDELITVAGQGKLREPSVLQRQVKRLLADPRSEALASNFAVQWLHLRGLADANPDVYLYPDSDDNLLQSMRRETELLFDSVVREDRNVLDLLKANYSFVDERLAKNYRIPNIQGNRFRRVSLADENRFGLLGHASVLTVTSASNRTSPVARGKWIMEQILGVSPPAPPPNVPALAENNVLGGETIKLRSVRDRLEQHRTQEPCRSCHKIMDPIGLALENFDAVGAWRTRDSGFPVDPTGELLDGTPVNSPAALRRALLHYSDAYVTNFTTRLLTYALGRGLSTDDRPTVRKIIRDSGDDNRFGSIVLNIVKSAPFQMRRAEAQPAFTAKPVTEAALIHGKEPAIDLKKRANLSQDKSGH